MNYRRSSLHSSPHSLGKPSEHTVRQVCSHAQSMLAGLVSDDKPAPPPCEHIQCTPTSWISSSVPHLLPCSRSSAGSVRLNLLCGTGRGRERRSNLSLLIIRIVHGAECNRSAVADATGRGDRAVADGGTLRRECAPQRISTGSAHRSAPGSSLASASSSSAPCVCHGICTASVSADYR